MAQTNLSGSALTSLSKIGNPNNVRISQLAKIVKGSKKNDRENQDKDK